MTETKRPWAKPTANFSPMPHQLIDEFPNITTISEMKVVLYILRHTWGYGDNEKHITLDEFQHGRKRRDGTRIDTGTGLSKPAIIAGLKLAVKHGYIARETEDSDRTRIRHTYRLLEYDPSQSVIQGSKVFTPDVKSFYPGGKKSLHRTEKETLEKNLRKEKNAPNGAGGEKPKAKSGPEPVPEPVPVPEPQDGDSSDTVGISGKAVSGKGITPPPARPLTAHQRLVGVLATRHGIAEGSPVPRPLASRLGKQVKILRGELCAEGLDLRVEFDDLPDLIRDLYAGWSKNYTIPTDGVKLAGEVREYVGTGKRAGHLPRDVNELLAEREQWGGA